MVGDSGERMARSCCSRVMGAQRFNAYYILYPCICLCILLIMPVSVHNYPQLNIFKKT